jgi:hypothetical protein
LEGVSAEEHRPDKTGIVPISGGIKGLGMAFSLFESVNGALLSEFARMWTLRNLLAGNCVMHIPLCGAAELYISREANKKRKQPSKDAFVSFSTEVRVINYPLSVQKFSPFS